MKQISFINYLVIFFVFFTACGPDDTTEVVDEISEETNSNTVDLVVEIEELPDVNSYLASMEELDGSGTTAFLLISESHNGAFKIDEYGQILVRANGYFNYETSPTLTAQFTANKDEEVKTLNLTVNLIDFQEQDLLIEGVNFPDGDKHISFSVTNGNITYYDKGDWYRGEGYLLAYDDLDRLVQFIDYSIDDGGEFQKQHTYTYNDNNQIVSIYYDTYGNNAEPYTRTVEYEGDKISFYDEDGSFSYSITLDDQGNITLFEKADGVQYVYGYEGTNLTSLSSSTGVEKTFKYTKFKNPFANDLFKPIYKGLIFSDGSYGDDSKGEMVSEFRNENHLLNNSFQRYIFNKNDYPAYYLSEDLTEEYLNYNYE
ncbi:hypothetical protein SCB49_01954 [unidentified eubacterium SCB49]|nr:hypothetical protein SCB49_01954 [unidentified eubacterium SCB49]